MDAGVAAIDAGPDAGPPWAFKQSTTVLFPDSTGAVAVADLDGDGWDDVVVAAWRWVVWVATGTGTGVLGYSRSYGFPSDSGVTMVGVADYNGDDRLDIITGGMTAATGSTCVVLLSNGIAYLADDTHARVAQPPVAMALADMDQDGGSEVIFGLAPQGDCMGVACFQDLAVLDEEARFYGGDYEVASLTSGLFDTDSRPDLAGLTREVDAGAYATLRVWRDLAGDEDGETYALPPPPEGTLSGLEVVAADMNGDGTEDLLVLTDRAGPGTDEPARVHVFPGLGDGTFGSPISADVPGWPRHVVAADLDGDGADDVVVAEATVDLSASHIWTCRISQDSTCGAALTITLPPEIRLPGRPALGRLDGDAYPDLVVGDTLGGEYVAIVLTLPQ
jgi:hypothetical protein